MKARRWDRAGVQRFETGWVSKAGADQRSGRAGRTGPGHCYRLYSSAVYEAMEEHAQPEMVRAPLEGVVLQLKALNVARVDNFPFPSPPERAGLVRAERVLRHLGALDGKGAITKEGREMQGFPLGPRFAKMTRLGIAAGYADLVVALVAALDVPEVFVPRGQLDLSEPEEQARGLHTSAEDEARRAREARRKAYGAAHAKMARLEPHERRDEAPLRRDPRAPGAGQRGVLQRALSPGEGHRRGGVAARTARRRRQRAAPRPRLLRCPPGQTAGREASEDAGGSGGRRVRRPGRHPRGPAPGTPPEAGKARRAIDVPYATLLRDGDEGGQGGFVYVHPSSVLARLSPGRMPEYVVYQRLQRSHKSGLDGDDDAAGRGGGEDAHASRSRPSAARSSRGWRAGRRCCTSASRGGGWRWWSRGTERRGGGARWT